MDEITDLHDAIKVQDETNILIKECNESLEKSKVNLKRAEDIKKRVDKLVKEIKIGASSK